MTTIQSPSMSSVSHTRQYPAFPALKRYHLPRARLRRLAANADPVIGVPGYYWLCRAYTRFSDALESLRISESRPQDLFEVVGALEEACAAAFSAWLSVSPSDEAGRILVQDEATRSIAHLPRAPPEIAEPLIRCATTANDLLIENGMYPWDHSSAWQSEVAEASAEVGGALDAIAATIEPLIDLAAGDTVTIEDLGCGQIRNRQELDPIVELEGERMIERRLFERFIERKARG